MRKLLATFLLLAAPTLFGQGVAVSARNGLTNPTLCNPVGENIFLHRTAATTADAFYICTAANTWTIAGPGGAPGYPLLAPNGSAAVPSYSFINFPSTGMYAAAGPNLLFSQNGVQALSFTGSQLATFAGHISIEGVTSTGATGSGLLVFGSSPAIVTPTIASFVNATHNHQNAAGGGTLTDAAITFTTPALGAPTATTLQTSGNVGLGGAPSGTSGLFLLVTAPSNTAGIIKVSQPDAVGTSAVANVNVTASLATASFQAQGSGRTTTRFGGSVADWIELIAQSGNGLHVGTVIAAPTGVGANSIIGTLWNATTAVPSLPLAAPTAGLSLVNSAEIRSGWNRVNIANSDVTALGASTTGDITLFTLPIDMKLTDMAVIIDSPDTSANALTIAVGRVSATFIDYIVASDAKAAANTVYGDASGERGTNLTGYDLPSHTGTTAVKAHFIKTTTNLSTVTGFTAHVDFKTELIP